MSDGTLRRRLSILLFLTYFIVGAWAVTLSTFLLSSPSKGGLLFTPQQTGIIYSTQAIAGILTPLLTGLLADRLFAVQKLLGVLHLIGGGLLLGIAFWCRAAVEPIRGAFHDAFHRLLPNHSGAPTPQQMERILADTALRSVVDAYFWPLSAFFAVYALTLMLNLTLSNVVAMRNLRDPNNEFGAVRVWGTFGWIVAGLVVELILTAISEQPLLLAGACSLGLGLFCFRALPDTPPTGTSKGIAAALGLPALSMFRDRSFAVLICCAFGLAIQHQFFNVYANKYLTDLQAPSPAALQTIAQISEMGCMFLFPLLIPRYGIRTLMLVGLIAWTIRNALFVSVDMPTVVAALSLHGIAYSLFFILLMMYVDQVAPRDLRAAAQGIVTCVGMGIGTLLGNVLAAEVVTRCTIGEQVDWAAVWTVPTFLCLGVLALFHLGVPRSRVRNEVPQEPKSAFSQAA